MKEKEPKIQSQNDAFRHRQSRPRSKAVHRDNSLELTAATTGGVGSIDFNDLVTKWTLDPAFDEVVASQRQIDLDKWN